ncbi:MAG: PQQ-dependent sugar dehydrogenase [Halomonadaceae bacterium]|nr:MAG: PQQ-dependent sugar dehydrogenase [Halomonadaceae bacterium]
MSHSYRQCSGVMFASLLLFSGALQASGSGQEVNTEYEDTTLVEITGGLEHPWGLAILPDGRYLVTERKGRLLLVDGGDTTTISGTPEVKAVNQGGLLDVVLHPEYEDNGWIYLTYSKPENADDTRLAMGRARLDGDRLSEWEVLFEQDRASSAGRHYGARMAWMNDGTLLLTVGDRGEDEKNRPQHLDDHAGSVLRLTATGAAAEGNPFAGQEGALPEIYSYGHRNIQGIIVHPDTGEIWVTEHGPRGGDELNLIEAGNNYGWPEVSLGRDYRSEEQFGERSNGDMTGPVYEFLPTLAPSGLALVSGDTYPAWQGNLLAGGLRAERVLRVVLEEQEVVHLEELLLKTVGRIRDVREGPDGHIYVLNDEEDAGLFRLEPR